MSMQINMINVETIVPNRFQPRKNFNQFELQELAESIKKHGMIQPMVLRKLGNKYEIIAGERRYKAALINGMITVPAIIMNLDDVTSAEVALLENVQRKDLTPIEEAQSYKQILQLGQMTQDEMAKKMGKNQSTISNKLRLLSLSDEVQQALLENKISERHARSLLVLKDHNLENQLLNKIIEKRLTVRETDNEIKSILENKNEEEIIDFDDEKKTSEEPEILDFDENSQISELDQTKEQINSLTQENPQPEVELEPTKEETQPRKRAKFFNLEEEPKMNDNNQLNQNLPPVQQQSEINPNLQFQNQVAQYNQSYSQVPTNQVNQGYSQVDVVQTYPNQPQVYQPYLQTQQYNQPYPAISTNQTNQGYTQVDIAQTYPNQPQTYPPYPQVQVASLPNQQTYYPGQQAEASRPYSVQTPNVPETPVSTIPQFGDPNMGVNEEEFNPQSMIAQQDITGAVSVIRNTIMNLQNNGYMLDAEEFDFENIHQITIKIQK